MTTCVPVQVDGGVWETAVFFEVGGKECKEDRRILRRATRPFPVSLEAETINHASACVVMLRFEVMTREDSPLAGEVLLTPALYQLLFEFARRKKEGVDPWLEIKPKNFDRSKTYDINDHNEIKRLLSALLDGVFGKENWTRDHHQIPLKNTLFEMSEKRERRIQLALPSENIVLN